MDARIEGRLLDAELAKALGYEIRSGSVGGQVAMMIHDGTSWAPLPHYSTDPAQTLALMERFRLSLVRSEDGWYAVRPDDIGHARTHAPGGQVTRQEICLVGREGEEWQAYGTAGEAVARMVLAGALAGAEERG